MNGTHSTRRLVLKAVLMAGGGLLVSLRFPRAARAAETTLVPNAFIRVPPIGKVIFISPHTEVGQGIYTSTAMLMAEELDLGLDQIEVQPAPPDLAKYEDPLLGDQATGGSTSTRSDWIRLRKAAAATRIMLVGAAAAHWQVSPAECQVARGVISHPGNDRTLTYGDVASAAASQPVPKTVPLKPAARFTLIGTNAPQLDTPPKVNGTAMFGIDTILPGMRIGTLAITPVKGGTLAGLDEAAARKVPGVHDVVVAPDKSAVAVFGDHMWAAKQGLAALNPAWSPGPNAGVTTAGLIGALDQASRHQGVVAKRTGDAAGAVAGAATRLEAVYQLPFLSHSPMEPLNCTLEIHADHATIWVGTQVPVRAQNAVARATGLPPEKVTVNNLLMGGAFGRRLDIDSIAIAAALAKQVPYPVKLVWTREEDMRHDYYRPYYYDRVSAGLDGNGRLVGWTHRVTGSSVMARWAPAAVVNGLDPDAVECAANTPYDVPAAFVDYVRCEPQGLGTGWWRGVGPTHNLFVVESFVDEIATAAKRDPVDFRRSLLQHNPRARALLDLAAAKSGWGTPLPPGSGRGIEVQFAFGSYLSLVVEVAVTPAGEVALMRAVFAVDCGTAVNPDTVEAQLQGGLILGLGTALYNQITLAGGAVQQSNFHDYRSLRMNEVPRIEVYRISSEEAPGGIGEAGTAAAAPALGNAIFAATGKRLRRLPFAAGHLAA